MKNLQARLFIALMGLVMVLYTSPVATAAQKKLTEAPVTETSTQSAYKFLVTMVETICPLPYGWPLV